MSQEIPSQRAETLEPINQELPTRFSRSALAQRCASRVISQEQIAFEADVAAGKIVLDNLDLTADLI